MVFDFFFNRVFIDLSKGSDTVDHNILLSKLEHNGIRGLIFEKLLKYCEAKGQNLK